MVFFGRAGDGGIVPVSEVCTLFTVRLDQVSLVNSWVLFFLCDRLPMKFMVLRLEI